jgi:hypothetical protein
LFIIMEPHFKNLHEINWKITNCQLLNLKIQLAEANAVNFGI